MRELDGGPLLSGQIDQILNKLKSMLENLPKSLNPDQMAIIIAALLYIIQQLWSVAQSFFSKKSDKIEENTAAVIALTSEIKHLETRLISVEVRLDKFDTLQHVVWKLESDVKFAHEKIRDLKQSI